MTAFERALRCHKCGAKEVCCEPQGAVVDASLYVCSACLLERVKPATADTPTLLDGHGEAGVPQPYNTIPYC